MVDALTLIQQRKRSPPELATLLEEILSGEQTVDDIIANAVGTPVTYERVQTTMLDLESLAEHNSVLGILLMTGLYEFADRVYAHDVNDGIELWIEEKGGPELAAALAATTPKTADRSKKLGEWLRMLAKGA